MSLSIESPIDIRNSEKALAPSTTVLISVDEFQTTRGNSQPAGLLNIQSHQTKLDAIFGSALVEQFQRSRSAGGAGPVRATANRRAIPTEKSDAYGARVPPHPSADARISLGRNLRWCQYVSLFIVVGGLMELFGVVEI
ncbi:hypothetical protein GWI33_012234 [Rhynchophorus ferrugineus]|uniref:Uncharacterized protein n=1 Tax=Rhynchophorus ferrugineus TaxID=354439 RepID=A0A834M7R8_RHYFE|nr:hypothetical protein GWI33_012234 [Rhynchophorus ferrugineus]